MSKHGVFTADEWGAIKVLSERGEFDLVLELMDAAYFRSYPEMKERSERTPLD